MKVAFNARLLHDENLRGWNRYTINLLSELPRLGVDLYLYTDRPLHPQHLARLPEGSYQVRVSPAMRYVVWEQRWLPGQCDADGVDLFHSPFNFGLPWRSSVPRALTLHDAIDSGQSSWPIRLHLWIARRRAERLITVSESAKRDIVAAYGIPAEGISVIYEGAEKRFFAAIDNRIRRQLRTEYDLPRPYVLYIGGWEPRKNIPFLMQSFASAGLDGVDLVLAGGNSEQRKTFQELSMSLGIAASTHLLGWVPDTDLPALYAEAMCFVYPSMQEGFGLQLCEAMAAGTPVLASVNPSLKEVLETGGETFTLEHTDELSNYLRRISSQPRYREELARRSRRRGETFSWSRMAEQTLAVYQSLVAD